MADTAPAVASLPSRTPRAISPPGIENPNPIASTSAHTLDNSPTQSESVSSSAEGNAAAASLPDGDSASISNHISDTVASREPGLQIAASSQHESIPPSISASLQAATAGLNEEDAKLLASLAEGNGLLNHLSNLAAQNASSNDLLNAYAGDLMLDSSTPGFSSTGTIFDASAFQGAVDLNEALTHQDMDWDDEAFDNLEPEDEDGQDAGPIQAYAKLEFPGFSYYIQTLDVTIGRRPGQLQSNQRPGALPPQLPNAASGLSQAHITSESKTEGDVDVDLGPLKSISRLHARIFYYTGPIHPPNSAFLNGTPAHSRTSSGNGSAPYRITSPTALSRVNGARLTGAEAISQDPYNIASQMGASAGTDPEQGEGQFVLMVVGRNGAFVDDVWVEKGGLVVLGKRTKIQIAERVFYFVLPPPPGAASYSVDGDSQRAHDSESDSLSDLSSDDQAEGDEQKGDEEDEEEDEEEEGEDLSSSVSSEGSGDDGYEDQDDDERDAAVRPHGETADTVSSATKGRRRPSAATVKCKPASRDEKPKRRLVLKAKSKVGKTSAGAAAEDADGVMDEDVDEIRAGKAKMQAKAAGKGKAATVKTTAAALANRALGKGKGKGSGNGAGRGKMPTKGPVPETRPEGDDSDSLGTPSGGEQSSEGEEDDGITTLPPPSNTIGAGAAGKRPGKGVKGLKGAKNNKDSKAKKADDAAQACENAEAAAAGSPVKKESPIPTWAMGAGIAGRKRKRGEAATDEEPALKVGTPIGIEALDAARRAKAAKARADASSDANSASPKKDKAAPAAAAPTDRAADVSAKAGAEDDDVVMVAVDSATPETCVSTATPANPASASTAPSPSVPLPATAAAKTTTTTAGTPPISATAGAAVKAEEKGAAINATPASTTPAKAKSAKSKTTKPKKPKKGAAAEETAVTASGVTGAPGSMVPPGAGTMGSSPMPVGTFAGSYAGSNVYAPQMPYDPNSASAASAIIAAANAVSGSMPGYGQHPQAQALPHAVGQMASSLPTIPSAVAGRTSGVLSAVAGAAPGSYSSISMPPSMTSLPAPTSTPTGPAAPGSDPSTWPTTASIIASAASLANAHAKQAQKPAATAAPGSTAGSTLAAASKATPSPAPLAAVKPPPGPEDKPDLSNIELISQALRSDHCAKKGAKLTLQEVYEWIANRWIWFKRNGRHTGRDWQSSIRHAIGSSRDFTRIPRRSDEPGKGIFYTMSDSKLAEQHRANLAKQKEEAAKAAAAGPPAPVGAAGSVASSVPGGAITAGTLPQGVAATNTATAAAGGTAAAGTPGSLPAIRIPLIIGTPPSGATPAALDKPKAAPGTIESLLETPPIVHHDGKLYLSPQVFGHLNAGQLAQIEGLGAQQALQVLQAYLVTHLKERMRLQQVAAQKKDASAPAGKASPSPAAAAVKPATTPAPAAAVAAKATPRPPAAASASAPKPASVGANGTASPVKSAATSASTATTGTAPVTTALPRPPTSATSLHPTPTLPKPVLPALIKPSFPTSSQSAANSTTPGAMTAGSTPSQPGKSAPSTAAAKTPAFPAVSTVAQPKAPVLPSTPLRTSVPAGPSTPKISTTASVPHVASSATPGIASTPPAAPSAPPKPASPVKTAPAAPTTGNSAAAAFAAPVATASDPPSATTAAGNGASKPAASSTPGTSATADTASKAGTPAPSAGSDSDDPLSALSALAAHPEAAALIALLRKQQQESGASGGGKQLAKLTPGQLQLLQMANKLAAQQGKGGSGKKKKKTSSGTRTGTREGTATPGPSGQESSPAPPGVSPSPGPKAW
ncbi:uncharacterized protein MEPE_05081 [Melanopsichium pennsylvanicum]|uniref:Fork-head domain-containing protein n=2 Tax=Melanopsichium pennsylvanicum TaxID=63383 RepID=A0AAJ5C6Z3_9BASI|nr:conserved hypothetical protein [Melanopsichium pennsylvanicum 4]SNX86372.1 uncharacterized protein MEPE_05081 [Melanopsichium pennsylvanicum]